ncbi:MAG TPA: hypothetical protein DCY79_16670 [Planctomycetaceae bacterium]|nr:hypothetical protein [Planctomycetaceae bacterium]
MLRPVLTLLILAVLSDMTLDAAERPVHLVILSGQSNMAGMNPKLGFEPEAKKLFPAADVVYFKVARGGQPIRLWLSEWDALAEKHQLKTRRGQLKPQQDYYQQILSQYQKLLAKHPEPASVTFCWMQGERDAKEKLSAAYGEALSQLIANLRRDLKQPKMHFVIGRLSDFGKPDNEHWQTVRKMQVSVAQEDDHGAWVDCDDLNNKTKNGVERDDLHYTQAGYELLGRRYARQMKLLIDAQPPAANGQPE